MHHVTATPASSPSRRPSVAQLCQPAAGRDPCQQEALDQDALLGRDAIGRAVLDALVSTVVAVMMVFAVVHVPVCLTLGRLAVWTHISDAHASC
jgi:hypothetical protein